MKKRLSLLMVSLVLFYLSDAQYKFTVKGKMTDWQKETKVYLMYSVDEKEINDSTYMKGGSFKLNNIVKEPTFAQLLLIPKDAQMQEQEVIYLDPGAEISINGSGDLHTADIKGGRSQSEYNILKAELGTIEERLIAASKKLILASKETKDETNVAAAAEFNMLASKMDSIKAAFITRYPNSIVSLYNILQISFRKPEIFSSYFDKLSPEIRKTTTAQIFLKQNDIQRKTSIGQPAIDFTQNDTNDNPVTLSSFKGKYVLLEFWASWCKPCRAENPYVVKAYNQFKDKNFEIVSVSLDSDKKLWTDAIKKDGLPWVHVSDLKGWKNQVALEYNVGGVPHNLLLDPNGIIIAKALRGDKLAEKLAEVMARPDSLH